MFEQALGDHHGLRQLKVATRLFKEHETAVENGVQSEEDDLILTYLGPMLARLTMSLDDTGHVVSFLPHGLNTTLIRKSYFVSISDARQCLDEIFDRIFPLSDSLATGARLMDEGMVGDLLESWSSRLHHLVDTSSQKHSNAFLRQVTLLRIRYCMATISHGTQFYLDESGYDKYTKQFVEIVQLSREILALEFIFLGDRALKPIITFDDVIIQPLYLTAVHCRDPSVRREAIALLESVDRTENALGSKIAAYVGTAVVRIEEAGIPEVKTCQDIPLRHRIRLRDIWFDPGELADSNAYVLLRVQTLSTQD